jgi:hypothetical protein
MGESAEDPTSEPTLKLSDGREFTVADVPSLPTYLLLSLLVDGSVGQIASGVASLFAVFVPREFIQAARNELAQRIDRTNA